VLQVNNKHTVQFEVSGNQKHNPVFEQTLYRIMKR
jgi:hypothetical protein